MLCNRGYSETPEYVNIEQLLIYKYDSEETVINLSTKSKESLGKSSSSSTDDLSESQKKKILDHKNYLRQNLMVPLTWALNKTLKYNPTNPIHYIACQLLRWKYKNINLKEKDETSDFVIKSTTEKDHKLLEKKMKKEKNADKSSCASLQH